MAGRVGWCVGIKAVDQSHNGDEDNHPEDEGEIRWDVRDDDENTECDCCQSDSRHGVSCDVSDDIVGNY